MELLTRNASTRSGGSAGPLSRAVAFAVGRVTTGEPARVFTTIGRHRRLFRAWLPFAATLLLRTYLPRADREIVILRTACNCSSPYVWAQHVPLAHRAGLGAGEIAATAGSAVRSDPEKLCLRQRLLVHAVDELHEGQTLSGVTLGRLRRWLDEEELLEVCMLVGHYTMLAMTLNSLGVTPEPGALGVLTPSERMTASRLQAAKAGSAYYGALVRDPDGNNVEAVCHFAE